MTTAEPRATLTVAHLMGRLSPGGGVQVVVRRLASALDPGQVALHVVISRPAWDDHADVNAEIHPIGFSGDHYRIRDRVMIAARMARSVRSIRPDVIQLHSGTAWFGWIARLLNPTTPFLLEVHDAPGSGRHGRWTDRFEGWLVRRCGVSVVCHSVQVEEALIDICRIPVGKIHRFPLGVDTDVFRPVSEERRGAIRSAIGVAPDATVVVAIGRPARSKRFDLAIEALASARRNGSNVELVVIGVGDDEALAETAARHDVSAQVHLLAPQFEHELAATIASCDILSSTSEYEGFGLTLAEGMACGLPVVAMSVGGVVDLVDDDATGCLVPGGDVEAFAAKLSDLASHPERRSILGAAGRQRAIERFSSAAVAGAFTRLYSELARRRRARGVESTPGRSRWRASST